MKFWKALFIIVVIGASAWLMYLIDSGLGVSWPQNTLRNWEQLGLVTLHGRLVMNPGGFEAISNPQIHYGMSPLCLYPAYFSVLLFQWTGLGTLSFHILLALAVFWGVWELLGKNRFAVIVAAIVILAPGYMRWQKMLDPNTLSILPVIPFAAIVLPVLKRQNPHPLLMMAVFLLTLTFMSLNWTTAWVCGPCLLLFLGIPGVKRRNLIWFFAVTALCGAVIVCGSVLSKSGMDRGQMSFSQLADYLAGYAWGSGGYGLGLTTGRAFLFLAFTNAIGLFPLWLAMGYAIFRAVRAGAKPSWLVFSPLALTVIEIIIMRDYFGHHPWMAAPLLLIGAVFSLALLRALSPEEAFKDGPLKYVPITAGLCFFYGLAVLAFLRINESSTLSMIGLVRAHTARSDEIVVVKSADPATANVASRFDESVDRHVVIVDDFKDITAGTGHYFILSAVQLNGPFTLIGQSSVNDQSGMTQIADWFNHSIAHRRPGDRMELAANYYLYQPKQ